MNGNERREALRALLQTLGQEWSLGATTGLADGVAEHFMSAVEQCGALSVWTDVLGCNSPLAERCFSFALTRNFDSEDDVTALIVADLMTRGNQDDASTFVNLTTIIQYYCDASDGAPSVLLSPLGPLLHTALNQSAVARTAAEECLLALAESGTLARLPDSLVDCLLSDLQHRDVDNDTRDVIASRVAQRLVRDDEFIADGLASLTAIATRVRHARGLSNAALRALDELLAVQRLTLYAAEHAHAEHSPVLAVRVSDLTDRPTSDLVMRSLDLFLRWFESSCESLNMEPVVRPLATATGSFLLASTVEEAPNARDALRLMGAGRGSLRSRDGKVTSVAETLMQLVGQYNASVTAVYSDGGWGGPMNVIHLDAAASAMALRSSRENEHMALSSSDVPQADELSRVFWLVSVITAGDRLSPDAIGVTTVRQINYYKHAARILGYLDEDDNPTSAGKQLAGADDDARLKTAAVLFESSSCGHAWIEWAGGKTLADVKPDTAEAFLRERAPSLSPDTARRRARTLAAWYSKLLPYHYSRWRNTER